MPQEHITGLPEELKVMLREHVKDRYFERPYYEWHGEDILEELEEVISEELDLCREEYPTTTAGELYA